MNERLWITGLGLVTPLGLGVEPTWEALVRGDRAIRPIRSFDVEPQRVRIAGEVDVIPWPVGLAPHDAAWSRTSLMAESAAREAMRNAHLDPRVARVGLVVGGTTGGMLETELVLAQLHADPSRKDALAALLAHPLTATADGLERRLGPFARARTLSSACSSGANAIVVAASWLLSGELDAVVAGGADGLCRLTFSGFNALSALDSVPCRPFDVRRRGTTLGEGAGFLVIERAVHAGARRIAPIAELSSWAVGSEAHHITNPSADGKLVASLIASAIARAGLRPSDVDYVNAHGTGTLLNDAMEAAALAQALGEERKRIPVSSSKGQIGHTLGAAGAIEAAITALVVARRTLVPTAGLDEPDAVLDLVHVPHRGRRVARVRAALSNAFGFGGMDTVLVIAEPELSRAKALHVPSAGRTAAPHRSRAVAVAGMALVGSHGYFRADECAAPVGQPPSDARVDPDSHLDAAKARRLDRAAMLAASVVEACLSSSRVERADTGLILGTTFANVDASAAFMHRIFEMGPRAARPADFPNLVPSAAVGHVSIYTGMHGPAFATVDLGASGESAFAQAVQLVACGEAASIVAGAAEPRCGLVQRVIEEAIDPSLPHARPNESDLAVAILVEAEESVRARGGRVFARISQVLEWRGKDLRALASLPAPRSARAEVLVPRANDTANRLLDETAWRNVDRVVCTSFVDENVALGGAAIAIAAARIGTARIDEALVLGCAKGHGFAIVLTS